MIPIIELSLDNANILVRPFPCPPDSLMAGNVYSTPMSQFSEVDRRICEIMSQFPTLWGFPQPDRTLNQRDSNTIHIIAQNINATFETNFVSSYIWNRWNTLKTVFFEEFQSNRHSVHGYRGGFPLFHSMSFLVNGEQETGRRG